MLRVAVTRQYALRLRQRTALREEEASAASPCLLAPRSSSPPDFPAACLLPQPARAHRHDCSVAPGVFRDFETVAVHGTLHSADTRAGYPRRHHRLYGAKFWRICFLHALYRE